MQKIEKSLNQTINQLLLMFCSFNTERKGDKHILQNTIQNIQTM